MREIQKKISHFVNEMVLQVALLYSDLCCKRCKCNKIFATAGREDSDAPIWAVMGGELLQGAFIMLVMGCCCVSCFKKKTFIQSFDPSQLVEEGKRGILQHFSCASELLARFGRGKRNTTEKAIIEIFVTIWEPGRIEILLWEFGGLHSASAI